MKTNWKVVLWENHKAKEYHTFTLDFDTKGWYVSTTSISAFSTREGTRLYNSQKAGKRLNGKRCHVKFGDDDFDSLINNLPHYQHNSVWEFYEAIGYDYKKKRYVK